MTCLDRRRSWREQVPVDPDPAWTLAWTRSAPHAIDIEHESDEAIAGTPRREP
jgi:hypothetical protein